MTFIILKTDWTNDGLIPEQISVRDKKIINQELKELQDAGHITIIDDYLE